MKTKNILMVAAAMAIGFASCSSEDELAQSNYPQDNVVRINTNMEGMKTRASYGNSTDNLRSFGFCINNANSTTYTYDNVEVTKDGSNWYPGSQMLWQNANTAVDILAYAPFQETTSGGVYGNTNYAFSVEETQSKETYLSDLIVYKKASFTPNTDLNSNKAVGVTFEHALSQLNLTLELRDAFNQDEEKPVTAESVTDVKINGTVIGCKVDFTANPISVTANNQATSSITPETVGFTAAVATTDHAIFNYSAIVIPQTVKENVFSIEFKVNDIAYIWTSTSPVTLGAGKSYQLKLYVGKEAVQSGAMNAKPWTEGKTADLETE